MESCTACTAATVSKRRFGCSVLPTAARIFFICCSFLLLSNLTRSTTEHSSRMHGLLSSSLVSHASFAPMLSFARSFACTNVLALATLTFSCGQQAAAAFRLSGLPNIFDAASSGNCTLLRDHIAFDPRCVEKREDARHASHLIHHTSHITHHTSHLTPHTSHITHHTSHIIHHTSHITHHTPHLTPLIVNHSENAFSSHAISELTPLHKSARGGHVDACKLLVQAGSDVHAKNTQQM